MGITMAFSRTWRFDRASDSELTATAVNAADEVRRADLTA